jgi:hypothetical protein
MNLSRDKTSTCMRVLQVLYQVDGMAWPQMKVFEALTKVKEQSIPAPSGPVPPPQRLEIVQADWGAPGATLCVTQQLLEMVEHEGSRLVIPASMKLTKVFGDPAVSVVESLCTEV